MEMFKGFYILAVLMCSGYQIAWADCSLEAMQACSGDLTKILGGMSGGEQDVTKMCSVLPEIEKCFEPLKSCNQEGMAQAMAGFNMAKQQCSRASTCSLTDFQKCQQFFEEAGDDPHKMCHATNNALKCMKDFVSKCDLDELKKGMQEQIDATGGNFDFECCQAVIKIREDCFMEMVELAETFNATEKHCQKLESAYVCMNKYPSKCKEGMVGKAVKEAVKGMDVRANECGSNGYKIVKDKNNGASVLQSTISALVVSVAFAFGLNRIHG